MAKTPRPDGRRANELRPTTLIPNCMKHPAASVRVEAGDTIVLCSASLHDEVPDFLAGKGSGWVTADYGMLPGSTNFRKERRVDARMQEIRRLIGRCARAMIALDKLGERTVTLDCDVIQADGGTRTASVTGACAALAIAVNRLRARGEIERDPLLSPVAAVSVGMVGDRPLLDLCYEEDAAAEIDMNVAMARGGGLVEVQATAEGTPCAREDFDRLIELAATGCRKLLKLQRAAVRSADL